MTTLTGVVAINDQARQYPPAPAPPQAAAQLPPGMMGPRRAVDTEGVQFRVAVVASDEARKVLGEQLGALWDLIAPVQASCRALFGRLHHDLHQLSPRDANGRILKPDDAWVQASHSPLSDTPSTPGFLL